MVALLLLCSGCRCNRSLTLPQGGICWSGVCDLFIYLFVPLVIVEDMFIALLTRLDLDLFGRGRIVSNVAETCDPNPMQ